MSGFVSMITPSDELNIVNGNRNSQTGLRKVLRQ